MQPWPVQTFRAICNTKGPRLSTVASTVAGPTRPCQQTHLFCGPTARCLQIIERTQQTLGLGSAASQQDKLLKCGRLGAGCSLSHLQEDLFLAEIDV